MAATPLVAVEAATGTTGSDGLAVFTFAADIDTTNHEIVVGGLRRGQGIDYTVTAARKITFTAPNIPIAGDPIWLFNGLTGTSPGTGLPAWDTVAELISDAAIELRLAAAPIANPFASTVQNIKLLIYYLKRSGRALAKERSWSHLTNEFTFNTANGQAVYPLPSDFRGMVDQSGWNRTKAYPLAGPVSPQEWQFMKAVPVAGNLFTTVRFQGGQIEIIPTPSSVETIAFEYLTTSWVRPNLQTSPTSDLPAAADDVVCFDPALVVAMLKLEFLKNNSFDTTAAQQDYDRLLLQVKNDDAPSRVLFLGARRSRFRRIDGLNSPDTGVGQ
jgi:hypothetical protein